MRSTLAVAASVLGAVATAGCAGARTPQGPNGVVCTQQYVYGLSVIVQDAATGQRICDADVTAVSGSYRETLLRAGTGESCSYAGAGERAGVYDLTATKAGFVAATANNVRVDANACHVIPAQVTLALTQQTTSTLGRIR